MGTNTEGQLTELSTKYGS